MRKLLLIVAIVVMAPAWAARAQTTLAIQTLPTEFDGQTSITFVAAASSMTFANDGRTFPWVKNASGGSITVTVIAVGPSDQGFLQNAVYTIADGKLGILEALSLQRFNALATGLVTLQFSATSGVEAAAVRMPHARR